MTSMYELGILGTLPKDVLHTIQAELESQIHELGLSIPDEVSIYSGAPSGFKPTGSRCSAAICSKCDDGDNSALSSLLDKGIPIIPVATALRNFSKEVPALLSPLNGLALDTHSAFQISTALLECATLLPRQRHVFISYRRDNGSEAALQLYSSLSARGFDIFLDTHKLHPGEHFQEVLWQRLCDCDVLLMLDTDRYFDSRWTNAEFGRAMSRGLAFVRVGWPGISLNPRAGAAVNLQLDSSHFETAHSLKPVALASIAEAVEMARTKSVAMRYQSLVDTLKASVSRIGGRLNGDCHLSHSWRSHLASHARRDIRPTPSASGSCIRRHWLNREELASSYGLVGSAPAAHGATRGKL